MQTLRQIFYITALVVMFAFAVPAKAATESLYESFDEGWRCFVSTQNSGQFDIRWAIPKSEFAGAVSSINYQTLKIATWNYVQAQGFYLRATSTNQSVSWAPTDDSSWINSNETFNSRTEGFQSGLSSYSSSMGDTFSGNVLTFTFPTNTVGNGNSSGTIWLVLRGNHPGNQGDRACIRAGGTSDQIRLESYDNGEENYMAPTGALNYNYSTGGGGTTGTTSSTWFGSGGAMTMNWTEASENITATTTFTDYGNDWLGSATSTIPGCYLQSTFGFMDFFKGLTAGDMSAQTLTINYGSSTIELDMSEVEFPPEFERYKNWFWNVFEVLGFLGLCILAVVDFINGYKGKDELSDIDE